MCIGLGRSVVESAGVGRRDDACTFSSAVLFDYDYVDYDYVDDDYVDDDYVGRGFGDRRVVL
jgi:GNAT superfamily N-acetyltransferase